MARNFDPSSLDIDQLMDLLQEPAQIENIPVIRAEIRQRVQRVNTPESILRRAVEDLCKAGRNDIAHAS